MRLLTNREMDLVAGGARGELPEERGLDQPNPHIVRLFSGDESNSNRQGSQCDQIKDGGARSDCNRAAMGLPPISEQTRQCTADVATSAAEGALEGAASQGTPNKRAGAAALGAVTGAAQGYANSESCGG